MAPKSAAARLFERVARSPAGYWYGTRIAPRVDPVVLRMTGGRFSSVFPLPVMLLTTTGAKSGLPRTLPLVYLVDGGSLVLIASNFGRTGHPAWYRNLVADPRADVLAGRHSGAYRAAEITDPSDREALWARAVDLYAGYGDYETRAGDRTIPVLRLTRALTGSSSR